MSREGPRDFICSPPRGFAFFSGSQGPHESISAFSGRGFADQNLHSPQLWVFGSLHTRESLSSLFLTDSSHFVLKVPINFGFYTDSYQTHLY